MQCQLISTPFVVIDTECVFLILTVSNVILFLLLCSSASDSVPLLNVRAL